MPRKLPWAESNSPSSIFPRQSATGSSGSAKRQNTKPHQSQSDSDIPNLTTEYAQDERAPSTSPPADPPTEEFMDDGLDKDDKYRMVEDELLSVAHKFTVHLHTAEYKRQEKMARARNAHMISSISRPVTGNSSDVTRRKLQAAKLAITQKHGLESFLVNEADDEKSDESDAGNGLPYVGTVLHGLMDSPRRKAASLIRPTANSPATSAAAGFRKQSHLDMMAASISPQPKSIAQRFSFAAGSTTGSSSDGDEFDDLDAPTLARKPEVKDSRSSISASTGLNSRLNAASSKYTVTEEPHISSVLTSVGKVGREEEYVASSVRQSSTLAKPHASRRAQSRNSKTKQEDVKTDKKTLDVIPTFL